MADRQRSDADRPGGNQRSSGAGGGKGAHGVIEVDAVGNARLRGEDPSPDDRARGQTSQADQSSRR